MFVPSRNRNKRRGFSFLAAAEEEEHGCGREMYVSQFDDLQKRVSTFYQTLIEIKKNSLTDANMQIQIVLMLLKMHYVTAAAARQSSQCWMLSSHLSWKNIRQSVSNRRLISRLITEVHRKGNFN